MKKYLFTGTLALVVCGYMTSCHENDDFNASIVEAKVKAFDEGFIEAYGQIQPGHTWGFGANSAARTRSGEANTNGGEWCLTYEVPYALTAHQKDIVRQYFQQVQDPVDESVSWSNFFVQDVYKGGTTPNTRFGVGERHYAAYGNPDNPFWGSNQMDQLTCANAEGDGNVHISNYNNAQCSSRSDIKHLGVYKDDYTPWTEESAAAAGKPWQNAQEENYNALKEFTDEITLMEGCSTAYFGYNNSLQSSYVYKDMFKRVSGDVIMAWASEQGITVPADGDVSGMMFVGFDYEADLSHGLTDNVQGNSYLVTQATESTPDAFLIPNKQGDNDWQKGKWYTAGARDHYYSDWIVRIVEATPSTTPPPVLPTPKVVIVSSETGSYLYWEIYEGLIVKEIGRVMAEDLGSASKTDMDFNDVVFDARIVAPYTKLMIKHEGEDSWTQTDRITLDDGSTLASDEGTPYANIKVLAAGGTIPLEVANVDIHSLFGASKTTMVNTRNPQMTNGAYLDIEPKDLQDGNQNKNFNYSTIDAIPIYAQYMNDAIIINNSGSNVPHKLLVPEGTPWPLERIEMDEAYNKTFSQYVGNQTVRFWESAVDGNVYRDNNYHAASFGNYEGEELEMVKTNEGTAGGATTYTTTQVEPDNTLPTVESGFTSVWNGTNYLYTAGSEVSNLYLYNSYFSSLTLNSQVRIYGVYKDTPIFSLYAGSISVSGQFYPAGYFEINVNSENILNNLKSYGLTINGSNFTVTNVAVKVAESEPTLPPLQGTVIWGDNSGEGNTTVGWGTPTVYLTKDYLAQQGVGENSIIRIYGIGLTSDWQIKVNHNWTGIDLTGWTLNNDDRTHSIQNVWGNNNEYNKGFEFTINVTSTIATLILADGFRISGNQFTVKYITVDNSNVQQGDSEPEFTEPANAGTLAYSTKTDISQGVSISDVDLSNAESVTVTVQGTTEGNASVSVNGVAATAQARKRTRAGSPVTYAVTLTGDNIGSSISITGSNFTVYKVYVKVTEAQSDDTTPTPSGGSVIYTGSISNTNYLIDASVLKEGGMTRNQAINVVLTGSRGAWSFDVAITTKTDPNTELVKSNAGEKTEYATWEKTIGEASDGYVTLPLTASQVNSILDSDGMYVKIYNWTVTKIELK